MNRSRVARMGRGRHARCLPAWWPWPRWPRAAWWRRPRMRAARETTVRAARPAAFPRACSGSTRTTRPAGFGPAANADGSPRIASVEAAYKRAGVSVVNDGVYDGPGAIRDTLRGALSKCVAGFRQRHPGEGDRRLPCRGHGHGRQQGGRWVYNGSGGYSASESGTRPGTRRSNRIRITAAGTQSYRTSDGFDDDPSNSVDKIAYSNVAAAGATPNLIIIVLDKYQPKPPTYHLSVSTQAAEMSGQSGDTKDASDAVSLSTDGSKTENVNGTATLHWRGIDGTEKTVAKQFTASNKGSATVSASFKDMDASWESWPAGKRWWDVDVAKQGNMAEAVSHKGENDGKESGEKTTTPPEKWLTNEAGDTVRDGNDSIASGSLYTAHIKAHSNASGKFWIYDTIDTRDVVIGVHRAGRRQQGDRDRRERQHRAGGHFHRRFHRWQARGQGARHRPAFRPLHAERATVGQAHRRRLRDQRRFRGVLERRQRHRQPGRLPDRQQRRRGQGHADPGQGVGAGRVRRSRGRGQGLDQPAGRRSEHVPRGRPGGRGRQRQHPRAPAQPAGVLFHHR